MDFAKRAHDHSFPFDPIVRSLLDTDFYKLLMLQYIHEHHFNDYVAFAVTNRTKSVRLADDIDIDELRAQLDHVRTLRFRPEELIWLTGQTFYGQKGLFKPLFIDTLRAFKLPDYTLREEVMPIADIGSEGDMTGQFTLEFHGRWHETSLWEIYALTILNEMRYRTLMKSMSKSQLDILYARAKVKLYEKLLVLNRLDGLNITDFGTRRRHSFLWQEHAVLTACEVLGDKFTGTSNAYLAMKHGLEAKGTNGHELPMALAALAGSDDEKLRQSQYAVLQHWQNTYDGGLKIFLPDTFGTTQFLANAPSWVGNWTGARPDSKKPIPGGEELISFFERTAGSAKNKLILFSDGMDVTIPGHEPGGEDIPTVFAHFKDRCRVGFGWGTMMTNDFRGCDPISPDRMKPISLVCKVKELNGRPAVKLSDNFTKATGPADEIERYRRVFGVEGVADAPVLV